MTNDKNAGLAARPHWISPEMCLILMAGGAPFAYSIWSALLNNFAVEAAGFTGREIGILQSLREIPGFLSFTAVFILLALREQHFAILSLAVLGLGVAVTGFFPSVYGLYFTTVLMSIGFHYYETAQMSLSLQWIPKATAPRVMGLQMTAKSISSIVAYGFIWLCLELAGVQYAWLFAIGGGVTVGLAVFIWLAFPKFEHGEPQIRKPVLRKRYWLYYALTFMGGARRQIFVVFAGFLLVTKFNFTAAEVSALYLVNHLATSFFAPLLGRWIIRFGERNALVIEYIGLIAVFLGYAYTESVVVASCLYVLDHVFFAFAIAQKSYLQKIADPRDIASTSSVSFSINHIAAVLIPWLFGAYLWTKSPALVFVAGAIMAFISLLLALFVPRQPEPGREVAFMHAATPMAAE
ncbi:MFS transporter [Kordiimonas pumila]|uniref:MFS transporter n=1 Tax=Kordiimonas pumila TaxID=2161677 RepID=A0ABV7D9H4_9PROT|nr:MFS transporter [Kordiimonas pumila]